VRNICSSANPANSAYKRVLSAFTVMKNLPIPFTVALFPATGQASKGTFSTRLSRTPVRLGTSPYVVPPVA